MRLLLSYLSAAGFENMDQSIFNAMYKTLFVYMGCCINSILSSEPNPKKVSKTFKFPNFANAEMPRHFGRPVLKEEPMQIVFG